MLQASQRRRTRLWSNSAETWSKPTQLRRSCLDLAEASPKGGRKQPDSDRRRPNTGSPQPWVETALPVREKSCATQRALSNTEPSCWGSSYALSLFLTRFQGHHRVMRATPDASPCVGERPRAAGTQHVGARLQRQRAVSASCCHRQVGGIVRTDANHHTAGRGGPTTSVATCLMRRSVVRPPRQNAAPPTA